MNIKQVGEAIWEIEKEGTMKVPALIFGTKPVMEKMKGDRTLMQLQNVASLEGIVNNAMVMPDGHEGYGFPIGGVAAFDAEEGIVSPGGIGYDINCGVRLVRTGLTVEQVKPKIKQLADKLFTNVPSGVGSEGKLRLSHEELDKVAREGTEWAVRNGYGWKEDLERTEEYGRMEGADPAKVTPTAKARGKSQIGTLGAGNHFLEIQKVEKIMNEPVAKSFGLAENEVVVMIHCGSRGYGHQICTDNLGSMLNLANKMNLWLPDRELVYAPIKTKEAQDYLAGMKCAVNFAFANRQMIMHWVRQSFDEVLGKGTRDNMNLVYDVAHNIAKVEEHEVDGQRWKLMVHRKGATRAFPAGRPKLPPIYRSVGQPVIIPGSMGTSSYVLVGNQKGLKMSWGSTCHGSGRVMSRGEAIRTHNPDQIVKNLAEKHGIYIRAMDRKVISEEAPDAYKNVDDVVKSVADAGISDIVAQVKPLAVVKG
ncbi:tRNA-splicing ligase RtcB [uncultured archaeon]|nr:tRNA-splicing ligase RtcB [uncultured archaeon]